MTSATRSTALDLTFDGTMRWRGRSQRFFVDLGGSRFEHVDLEQFLDGTEPQDDVTVMVLRVLEPSEDALSPSPEAVSSISGS